MTLLALYWSIMIACYLLASRLRKYAEKFKFVDKLMSLSVYALVLLMGLRMGADEEVTSSLGSIGIQALFVTVLTAAGSMLGAFAVRKLLHIDRHTHPAGAVVNEAEAVHEKADVSGAKMSFIILLMVVVGMLLGDLVIRRVCTDLPAFQSRSGDYLVVGLCIMLGLIGFSMGLDGSIARILRNAGLGVILVPIFAVLGTLLGGAVYAALSPMTLREGLAISAGFGWYTMAPSVIASAGHTMASAVSFLHNVLREMLGIILLPVIAGKIGYIEAMPVVVDPGVLNPYEFIGAVINRRLPNPFMPDAPQRIATDTSQKLAIRFGETIKAYEERGLDKSNLVLIPLVLAGYARYLTGLDDNCQPLEISPDPLLAELQAIVAPLKVEAGEQDFSCLKALYSRTDVFGVDLYAVGLGEKIESMAKELFAGPGAVRATLHKYVKAR